MPISIFFGRKEASSGSMPGQKAISFLINSNRSSALPQKEICQLSNEAIVVHRPAERKQASPTKSSLARPFGLINNDSKGIYQAWRGCRSTCIWLDDVNQYRK
eukprot:scaffold82746_cov17-Prasinocladus_malaysianus.AAC.1